MLITTPIFYVNASPHIGHVHSAVLADALSRWYTVKNRSVVFTTGTDEHGLKVQEAAENSGTTDYQRFCDDVSSRFDKIFQEANVQYSRFIRTSDPDHHEAVDALWRKIHDNGFIYLGEHEAWYCKSDESFLTETQVEDRTDAQGQTFKVSKESGHKVEKVREENYKFKLSAFQDRLLEWLDACAEEDVIVPRSRHNEVRAAVAGGLRDVSVSRLSDKIQWAIKVPDDANHCVYVWLDALTNYLTCAGYPGETSDTWPADYHIVGKDIIKFHAIYWPAFLMAAGLPLPKRIVAHAHWTVDNVKMSKSLGNVVDPHAMLAKYGSDFVRYFLLREGVLNDDGDFSTTLLEDRVNSELADTLGNLVSRSTGKSFLPGGVLPSAPLEHQLNDEDMQLIAQGQTLAARVEKHFETPDFSSGLKEIVFFLHDVN
uniref:methionine--tRNA ligase n=1 Tax=Globisporangium ultimum (strain ATCC 200006 / CBS 805.95 / DAOM BR144) TaxID=431595 RepID=K3X6P3_GLOUD